MQLNLDEINFSFPEECALAPFLTEECRLRLVNKEKADCFSRVPEPFGSFQLWKERIERLEEKYKWTIKVKIYHKIELLIPEFDIKFSL